MTKLPLQPYKHTCQIICGDSRQILKGRKIQADVIITSPPYADARKRHYDSVHPEHYANWFVTFHRAFWDALTPTGSLVLNIKDKIVDGVRHRYVWQTIEALTSLGWYCIDDYIWVKPNAMPGYWPTRLRDSWEFCFHLAKCKRPYINQEAVKIPASHWVTKRHYLHKPHYEARESSATGSGFGRVRANWKNKTRVLPGNVLTLSVETQNQSHPAVFPKGLPDFFIKLLCPEKGWVLDPFAGSGTTGVAAINLGRNALLIDNNRTYCEVAKRRIETQQNAVIKTLV